MAFASQDLTNFIRVPTAAFASQDLPNHSAYCGFRQSRYTQSECLLRLLPVKIYPIRVPTVAFASQDLPSFIRVPTVAFASQDYVILSECLLWLSPLKIYPIRVPTVTFASQDLPNFFRVPTAAYASQDYPIQTEDFWVWTGCGDVGWYRHRWGTRFLHLKAPVYWVRVDV